MRDDERAEGPFLVELRRAVSPAWELVARARTEPGVERRLHAWHGTRLAPGDLVRVVEGRGRTVWLGFATAAGELRAAPPLAVEGGRFGDPQWLDPIDGWEGTQTTACDLLSRTWDVDTRRLVLVAETAATWALGHRHQDTTAAARHAAQAARAWAVGEGSAEAAARASRAADAANPSRDRAIEAAARAAEIPGAKARLQRGLAVGAVIAAEGVVRGQLLARMVRPHLPLATVLAARLGLPDPLPLGAPTRPNPSKGRGISTREPTRDAWAFCRRTGRDAWVVFAVHRSGHRVPMGWRADHAKALALRDEVARHSLRHDDDLYPPGMEAERAVDVIVVHARDVRG